MDSSVGLETLFKSCILVSNKLEGGHVNTTERMMKELHGEWGRLVESR